MQLPRKMSAQNVMASISRTLGNRNDGNTKQSNEIKLAGDESKDKLYLPKHRQKVVRVLTVVAYVVSVSLAAIILSLYYTFIWDPKDQDNPRLFTSRPNNLNSTARVECLNVTSPMGELTRMNDSHITREPIKSITNYTESLEKISSIQADDEMQIEIVPGPAGESEPVSQSLASAAPAVIQPQPKFMEKKGSEQTLTPEGDSGFI